MVPSAEAAPAADSRLIYMTDMTSRASESAVTSNSVVLESMSGQMPSVDRHRTAKAKGMMRPVSGKAMRLVRRKWIGNVPKYMYASGPVVIWHDMDKAAVSQIHRTGRDLLPMFPLLLFSGQKLRSHGKMKAIPAIAA